MHILKKRMSLIYTLVIGLCLTACTDNNHSALKESVMMSGYFTAYPIIVPMIHEYASFDSIRQFDTIREDTFLCCSNAWRLYKYSNIRIDSYQEFQKRLYNKLVNKEYITINTSMYEVFSEDKVVEVPEIRKLYEEGGIDKVLLKYVHNRILPHENPTRAYIVYLASLHDILFGWDDECGDFFLESTYSEHLEKIKRNISDK